MDTLLVEIFRPIEITLDTAQGKMYWSDPDAINRANLDGTDAESVQDSLFSTQGVSLDLVEGKLYWVSNTTSFPSIITAIQRSNLDGSEPEVLMARTAVDNVRSIVIDEMSEKLYWADFGAVGKLQRANLDGSDIEDLVVFAPQDGAPRSVSINPLEGKMYWTNQSASKVQRANLDGSEIEDLVTFPRFNTFGGITLDIDAGKVYWVFNGQIQRSNLDGSDVEDSVIPDADNVQSIVIDELKLYWTGSNSIKRSNLDGSEQETLANDVTSNGIALDKENSKVYWINDDTYTVQRANLDGTEVEVITDFYSPIAVAVLPSGPVAQSTDELLYDLSAEHLNLSGYPNPFYTSTTIEYSLDTPQRVTVTVYDVLGRVVSQLTDAYELAGHHEMVWDGLSLPAGAYFVHIATDSGLVKILPMLKVGR